MPPESNPSNPPAGDDPSKRRCTAVSSRTGKPCRKPPIQGGTVCASHGGRAPQVQRAAARRLALGEAIAELDRLGRPIDVEPADAMLDMVREAAGNVAFLRARVQELDQLTRESKELEAALAVLGGGGKDSERIAQRSPAGIYGQVDPRNWRAERHVVVAMYDDERERLVRWAKACRDAGVDERRVQLAEDTGRMIADVLRGALAAALQLVVALLEPDVAGRVRERWAAEVPAIVRGEIAKATGAGA